MCIFVAAESTLARERNIEKEQKCNFHENMYINRQNRHQIREELLNIYGYSCSAWAVLKCNKNTQNASTI